jgi:hypothetical protein
MPLRSLTPVYSQLEIANWKWAIPPGGYAPVAPITPSRGLEAVA